MAKQAKTMDQRVQEMREKANAELAFLADPEARKVLVSVGTYKGRIKLEVSKALARETAQAEHEITLAKAALIDSMDASERSKLQAAMGVLSGLGAAPSKSSNPTVESNPETTAPIAQ